MTSIITRWHYAAIFTIALAGIAAQILVSRILSVTLYYHYAFAGITIAMLGLTAGAMKVYRDPLRFGPEQMNPVLARVMPRGCYYLLAAVLIHITLSGLVLQWLPDVPRGWAGLDSANPVTWLGVLSLLLLLFAFIDYGIGVCMLLTRTSGRLGNLYACDLLGAALGCIVVGFGLVLLDPVALLLLISCLMLLIAGKLYPPAFQRSMLIIIALSFVLQAASYAAGAPIIRILWLKNDLLPPGQTEERWTAYSRISGFGPINNPVFGWGFGTDHSDILRKHFYIQIDGGAGTAMTEYDGNPETIGYLKDDVTNLTYHVRLPKSVAIIGAGGGRDILSALAFGSEKILAIDLNPVLVDFLTGKYADFSGRLAERPGITLVNAEARSYLASRAEKYDSIQISLIDTWAATVAGGLTLWENKLYTTDAWQEMLAQLNENGTISITRFYRPDGYRWEMYRMLAMAAATVQVQKPGVNPREYILVAQGGDVATMVLSNTPWTKEDIARFELAAKRYHFMPILTPDKAYEDMLATLATGADMSIFDQLPHDVSPTTDDRPFFFNMKKPFDLLRKPAATGEINDFGTHLVVYLSIFTLLTSLFFILRPLYGSYVEQQLCWRQIWPYSHYFALIGLGFMFIEISQMQRLMIFLGHPIYGLCVVLFTLLLASGAGSMVQPLFQRRMPGLWMQPLFVCLVLAVVAWCMPMLTGYAKHYDILPRILISVIILIPLGFVMGMMFPAGAAMVEERQSNILPWYWGINGAASVFASVFAIVLSLQCGISFTFWVGVACYALCVPLVWYIQHTSKEP